MPSHYNYYTDADDPADGIIFHRGWGSVVTLPRTQTDAVRLGRLDELSEDERIGLADSGLLVPTDVDEMADAQRRYRSNKWGNPILSLTLEMTQECNLGCRYCYQN